MLSEWLGKTYLITKIYLSLCRVGHNTNSGKNIDIWLWQHAYVHMTQSSTLVTSHWWCRERYITYCRFCGVDCREMFLLFNYQSSVVERWMTSILLLLLSGNTHSAVTGCDQHCSKYSAKLRKEPVRQKRIFTTSQFNQLTIAQQSRWYCYWLFCCVHRIRDLQCFTVGQTTPRNCGLLSGDLDPI